MVLQLQLILFGAAIVRGASTRSSDDLSHSVSKVAAWPFSKTRMFSLFRSPKHQKEAEALSGGGADPEKRDRLKKWLQAADVIDCGVTDLAGRLLAKPMKEAMKDTGATSEKEIDWDDITSDIDWITLKHDFDAHFDSVDRSIEDAERRLASSKAELEKVPVQKFVDKAKVIDVLKTNLKPEYCQEKYTSAQHKDVVQRLEDELINLAESQQALLSVSMVRDAFIENYPSSAKKLLAAPKGRKRGAPSPCFELKSKVSSDLRQHPISAGTNKRKTLEDEVERLSKDIERQKMTKRTCEARLVDLNDFQQMISSLKHKREEKVELMEAADQTIHKLSSDVTQVTGELESKSGALTEVVASLQVSEREKATVTKHLDRIKEAINTTTRLKAQVDENLTNLKKESEKATTAVEVAEKVKAKVSYFVQVFLETYKQGVRAPIGKGLAFNVDLSELNSIADKMIEDPIKKLPETYTSFEKTVKLITDLSSYCTKTALPALGQVGDIKVKDDDGKDATPSAICTPTAIHSDVTRAQLESHINVKRKEIGHAIRLLTKLMADDESTEEGDDDSMMDQRLQQFQIHGHQSIYDDYLRHWRVTSAASSGKEGNGRAKKGLYLELVLQLRGLRDGLRIAKELTMKTIKSAEDSLKTATASFDRMTIKLEALRLKLKKDKAQHTALTAKIQELKTTSVQLKDQLASIEKEKDDLDDEVERIEALIVDSHGQIKASLLQLGIEEHEFESELERVREELRNSPAHFALEGLI